MKQQNYNDGVVEIHSVIDVAKPGDKPKDGLKLKERLRFERRTVGVTRYNEALANNVRIEELLRCPRRETVSPQDVVTVRGKQYRIERAQYPKDIVPPSMDLELSRLERDYER